MKEILDPWGPYLPMWNTIFAISSVIAVSTDPLFLYTLVLDLRTTSAWEWTHI